MDSPPVTTLQMPRRTEPLTIVRDHQAGVWRYLRYLGCDAAQAEDLTQETFLSVLRQPFEDRGPARTGAYLRSVARNLFLKAMRRRAIEPATIDPSDLDATWDQLCGADGGDSYLDALRECLDVLDGRGREALRLRYEEARPRAEMAAALGLSSDGVKTMLRRVRELLKNCVERRIG
ncbi:MAG: sigma-70 family RNA polymerase sigma factor [Planctomycetes bacterium]|nr:sigma-70 family RNA polymerase sigma factor [Planctomycetota bacterium]